MLLTENHYIMWLNSIFQLNPKCRLALLKHYDSAKAIWDASSAEISRALHLSPDEMYNLVRSKSDEKMEKLFTDMEKANARFVSYLDNEYPEMLHNIPNAPIGFYIIGEMPKTEYFISIVGSRHCTEYGASNSYNISKKLAENDIVIVSGMADGIDSYAHKGALDGGGKTIAVLGTGIDICYPSSNRNLRENILKNGCIISEYPPGTRGTSFTFPQRNRIISGLSQAVVIVEAAKRSGSLITADLALNQGRDIFAVPGNITSNSSYGSNKLIKDGAAALLLSSNDILEYFNINTKKTKKEKTKKINNSLAPSEKLVYDCIDLVPQSIDDILQKTNLDMQTLQSTLALLEISGTVTKISGQRYVRSQ